MVRLVPCVDQALAIGHLVWQFSMLFRVRFFLKSIFGTLADCFSYMGITVVQYLKGQQLPNQPERMTQPGLPANSYMSKAENLPLYNHGALGSNTQQLLFLFSIFYFSKTKLTKQLQNLQKPT